MTEKQRATYRESLQGRSEDDLERAYRSNVESMYASDDPDARDRFDCVVDEIARRVEAMPVAELRRRYDRFLRSATA